MEREALSERALAGPTLKTPDLPVIDEALIERVNDRILETFDPEAVYLFGSAARGKSRHGSDLDLLVVMELPQGTSNLEMSRAPDASWPSLVGIHEPSARRSCSMAYRSRSASPSQISR